MSGELIKHQPEEKPVLEAPEPAQAHFPTAKEKRVEEVNEALGEAYKKAGTLKLTDAEHKDLTAPFEEGFVETRPHDGLYYIPHIHVSDRLTRVFGPGQWTMIRRWESIEGNTIYAEWVMIVRGIYIGESVGAADYHPNNKRQNFSDALESTRGEALRRIAAKYLACGSQVWSPAFRREKPKGPAVATEKTRKWMIEQLADIHDKALAYAIDRTLIMPNQTMDDWPLDKVPTSSSELTKLRKLIESRQ